MSNKNKCFLDKVKEKHWIPRRALCAFYAHLS